MKFWSKTPTQAIDIHPRIKKMDTPSLINWLDSTLMSLGASLDRWRFHSGEEESVDESLEALNMLWAELKERRDTGNL
jgi:hypothetical protein